MRSVIWRVCVIKCLLLQQLTNRNRWEVKSNRWKIVSFICLSLNTYHISLIPNGFRITHRLHLIEPTVFEVWTMNADGKNKRQITKLNSASFAPFFTPDGKRIIFCTNYFATDERKRNFDLALINIDGTGLERVTYNESFDGFPMFSPDGKKLVFASNRNAKTQGDTNVFIADWVE